jgi:hypothetical protein
VRDLYLRALVWLDLRVMLLLRRELRRRGYRRPERRPLRDLSDAQREHLLRTLVLSGVTEDAAAVGAELRA